MSDETLSPKQMDAMDDLVQEHDRYAIESSLQAPMVRELKVTRLEGAGPGATPPRAAGD